MPRASKRKSKIVVPTNKRQKCNVVATFETEQVPCNNIVVANCSNETEEHYLGAMEILCIHCKSKHFESEKVSNKGYSFNDCCSHDQVVLNSMKKFPPELKSLLDGTHPNANIFQRNIRSYNSAFSFASFNANLVNLNAQRPGPYCFKIQGQIYYQINTSLFAEKDYSPSFGQLYIVDQNAAADYRLEANSELDRNILQTLDLTMRSHNSFAQSYQMMYEELKIQEERCKLNNTSVPEIQLLFTLKKGMDRGRFNFQRTNEVAAVFTMTADGEIAESYVTIRNRSSKALQYVSTMDANVEPWIYPLFYPYGTPGWHSELKRLNSNKRISRAAYIKYRIAIRPNEFNAFLLGRRLFQQWVVDNYVKIEKDRIQYCKNNQKQLRADTYQGLIDYLQNAANDTNRQIGKMVILPSSFIGSPRNMMQEYQDAMAIVRKFGKPDLFLTMTCNPKWREIVENLFENQDASDRPDLCARVFQQKVVHLIEIIVKKQFFGKVAAFVYVIEFQKRGLPHIHLLITLDRNSKITTSDLVDKYISAEIPDAKESPVLHKIVLQNMIHGPCGDWCMVNGKCSKHYPKSFNEETIMSSDSYPFYQRKQNGKTFQKTNNYIVDNRHVVPYCPQLILLFNCHMNVEVVSSVKSVKYIYKYIYKGHDAAALVFNENQENEQVPAPIIHDEIQDYLEARYVGPVEACWRILSKPLRDKSHHISRLPVHLRYQHNIIIDNNEITDSEATISALNQTTMLIDYFALNARDENAKKYLYTEIPCHYTFKKEKVNGVTVMMWKKRKSQFNCVGRMYSVSPTQIELYHLRLLLLSRKGAKGYDDLKTVNNKCYETFVETCLALGLIEDDEEWERAMQEATVWMMPGQLRRLFVRILIHCQPIHPENLWKKFKTFLSKDYTRTYDILESQKKAYAQINVILQKEGKSLADYPQMLQILDNTIDSDDDDDLNEEIVEIGQQQYAKLNTQQKEIVDMLISAVKNKNSESNCFYIDGPGGSGKTFIYTTLYNLLKNQNKVITCMAFTGIAATLLPEGKTVHKTFGLPVPLYPDSSSNIKAQSKEGQYLRSVDIFIWDEAPMAPRYALEIIDHTLRDLTGNDSPFGSKIILLGGDFRQLLPIKMHGTRSETVNLSIKYSVLWKYFTKYSLIQNMRVLPKELTFAKFLLDVGNGILNDHKDNICLPQFIIASKNDSIVNDVYGSLMKEKKFEKMSKCAILSARNADVDEINKQIVELLSDFEEKIYNSVDTTENCDNGDMAETLLPEYLNSLNPPSLPPHELRLRKNAIIMLIRNLSISEGLCNGTRLRILELANNLLKCIILTGDKTGQIVFLNRITLCCENEYPFTFKRRQFPIKLAFAMTINKSQGQTFDKIGLDLRKDVFNHGQLYVALSRVRSSEGVRVYLGHQRMNRIVKNYVYSELFSTN